MDDHDDSGDDSQADDLNEEDNLILTKQITDEYFAEISSKTTATIKSLQADQKYSLAEQFQLIFAVCQNVRNSLNDEKAHNAKMQNGVSEAVGKVAAAFEISQNDQDTIVRLKEEIENAWKQTDAAKAREQTAQEQLYEMRHKWEALQAEVKKSEKKEASEDLGLSMAKQKEGLIRERDRLTAEVEELQRRLKFQRSHADEMEKRRLESENKNKELYKILDETSSEAFKEKRILDQLRIDLAAMTIEKNNLTEDTGYLKGQAEIFQSTIFRLNTNISLLNQNIEKTVSESNSYQAKCAKILAELETIGAQRDLSQRELNQVKNLLKLKESESKKGFKENAELLKSRDNLQKKLMLNESQKAELSQDVTKLKNNIVTFEKERDSNKKAFDKVKKFSDEVIRERDLVRKDLQRANRVIGEQAELVLLHDQHLKTLEVEIKQHLAAAQKQKTLVAKVEKERDRNAEESHILSDKVEQVQDDLTLKINQIVELKEMIEELRGKIAQIQQSFEIARTERNVFQKDLQTASEDRDDYKNRLRILTGQNDQLKEDIDVKEAELLRSGKQIDKLEKEKVGLRMEIQNITVSLQHSRSELKEKKIENERLYKTLSDDEIKITKLNQQLEATLTEKDIISTQLIRRNDEIGLLNEKMHIIQMALDRGEAQYNKRLDDIRLLKIEIGNLRSQRNLLARGSANTADMRQEVLQLNRVLTQERVKAKALEQEMSTPMNIHRWRKLSGKDPDKMDLIVKVQMLQKRILTQTVFVTEKEQLLDDAHRLNESMKQFMLKLPSFTIKQKLNNTQRSLTAKSKKLKAISAEMNSTTSDAKLKELTLHEYKTKLLETKQELLKERKEKQKYKDELRLLKEDIESARIPYVAPGYKTLGAGFKVNTTTTGSNNSFSFN